MNSIGAGPDGYGLTSKAITCLEYCARKGAKVISASWTGGTKANPPLEDAVRAAGAGARPVCTPRAGRPPLQLACCQVSCRTLCCGAPLPSSSRR